MCCTFDIFFKNDTKWKIVALIRKYTTWLEMQQVLSNSVEMKVIQEYGWDNLVQY